MQIIILGMHRSGTSMLTRLINLMGVYFGETDDAIGTNQENPNGFWERKDVRKINDYVLHSSDADWDLLANFDESSIDLKVKNHFAEEAGNILKKMDHGSNWLIKEPRTCVLFELWKSVLNKPIFIHIYRNPVEVAASLFTRNGISVPEGIALWEKYNIDAINGAAGHPRILVSHQSLIKNPVAEIESIYSQLIALGVKGLESISEDEILSFVDSSLYRERYKLSDLQSYLNEDQVTLFKNLESGVAPSSERPLKLSKGARLALENYQNVSLKIKDMASMYKDMHAKYEDVHAKYEDVYARYKDLHARYEDVHAKYEDVSAKYEEAVDKQIDMLATLEKSSLDMAELLNTARWKLGDRVISAANSVTGRNKGEASINEKLRKLQAKVKTFQEAVIKKS